MTCHGMSRALRISVCTGTLLYILNFCIGPYKSAKPHCSHLSASASQGNVILHVLNFKEICFKTSFSICAKTCQKQLQYQTGAPCNMLQSSDLAQKLSHSGQAAWDWQQQAARACLPSAFPATTLIFQASNTLMVQSPQAGRSQQCPHKKRNWGSPISSAGRCLCRAQITGGSHPRSTETRACWRLRGREAFGEWKSRIKDGNADPQGQQRGRDRGQHWQKRVTG